MDRNKPLTLDEVSMAMQLDGEIVPMTLAAVESRRRVEPAVAVAVSGAPTLATGAALTPETFADFVARLKHHCVGAGVDWHSTADAVFCVQSRQILTGIDRDYTSDTVACLEESMYFSPTEFYEGVGEKLREDLDRKTREDFTESFLALDIFEQWSMIGDLDGVTVTGYHWTWEHVNSHFTKEAAEAFIARKSHDYRHGLRVYVDAQLYCWEWNTIKAALMAGKLVLKGADA